MKKYSAAVEYDTEAHRPAIIPVRGCHLAAAGIDPGHIADVERCIMLAGQKAAAAQDRIVVPELDYPPGVGRQLLRVVAKISVEPGDIAVQAIRIVVALLGEAELVAAEWSSNLAGSW